MSVISQASLATRPTGRVSGFQVWRDLLFLHWRVAAEELRRHIPPQLEIETFDGHAWLGLVPFEMLGVRPWWSPAIGGVSKFFETNVRTYVSHPQSGPGVWFFSLDASSRLAVMIARRFWHLNYFSASLSIRREPGGIFYRSGGRPGGGGSYSIDLRSPDVQRNEALETAGQGSLAYFLLERYLLYTEDRSGGLRTARVFHAPYRFLPAASVDCRQQLTTVQGLPGAGPPDHVLYSPGVDVEVFPLRIAPLGESTD